MEIKLLESFLTLARMGSFSDAAETLFVTQSALSKQIKRLERELGAALFVRTSRTLTLTEAGRAAIAPSEALLQANAALRYAVCPAQCPLRIGALPVLDAYGLTGCLSEFARQHPQHAFLLEERENSALPACLDAGTFDLILVRSRHPKRHDWRYLTLWRDELAVVTDAAHPLAQLAQPIDLAVFADQPFLLLGQETQLYEESMTACRNAGFSPHVFYRGSSAANLARLIKEKSGVAIFMRQVALALNDPALAVLSFQNAPQSELVLAAKRDKQTPAMQALWQYMKAAAASKETQAFMRFLPSSLCIIDENMV